MTSWRVPEGGGNSGNDQLAIMSEDDNVSNATQAAHPHQPSAPRIPAGVAEELLWFVSGCTNAKVLQDKVRKVAARWERGSW